ncbi:MAG: tripartite tricarboxylate transporter TctB family protein [Paracoccaceae bacterium]
MRVVFLVVLLAGSIYYTYVAFSDLDFLTRTGRPGPGFFPRVIGGSAVILTLWTLIEELRKAERVHSDPQRWKDVALLIVLALGYAVLLRLFGGFVATVIFLGVTLMILNRTQPGKNLLLAILIPSGVYLLFDRVLNANMPPALFELPI